MMLLLERPSTEEVQICRQDKDALAIEHGDDRERHYVTEKAIDNEWFWFTSGHRGSIV
ncbi:MAG: hypothetical protein K6G04_02920 [Lachnospiraceae bacterium]|nr:hypothetical protein [Lachnospiraceae bacterium]